MNKQIEYIYQVMADFMEEKESGGESWVYGQKQKHIEAMKFLAELSGDESCEVCHKNKCADDCNACRECLDSLPL